MKYIRTKDGIFELDRYKREYKYFKMNGSAYKLQKVSECKQANTIEELCEEFVLEKNDYFEYTIFRLFTTAKSLKLENVKNKEVVANVYGAIWTDKGLIYVAKMNEKGELELL